MPIKHLTPRDENEVNEFFSQLSNKELFYMGFLDKYAQTLLVSRLGCNEISSIQAEYLWPGRNTALATNAYVKIEYTVVFIVELQDISRLKAQMFKDFGNFTADHYNYETKELIITFTS